VHIIILIYLSSISLIRGWVAGFSFKIDDLGFELGFSGRDIRIHILKFSVSISTPSSKHISYTTRINLFVSIHPAPFFIHISILILKIIFQVQKKFQLFADADIFSLCIMIDRLLIHRRET
jgi:hypothetical protein